MENEASTAVANGLSVETGKDAVGTMSEEQSELLAIMQQEFNSTNVPEVSFRPPFSRLPRHDVRADAIDLIQQSLLQKNIPLWAAIAISLQVVEQFEDELEAKETGFDKDVYETIEANAWYKNVNSCLRQYIQRIIAGTAPIPTKSNDWNHYLYSLSAIKNGRRKMEDRHVVLPTLNLSSNKFQTNAVQSSISSELAFFAVFDGHGGSECANQAAACMSLDMICRANDEEGKCSGDQSMLSDSLEVVDLRMTSRCMHENIRSGTTVACALVNRRKRELFVSWCGDSAVALLRADHVATLTAGHKPDDPDEQRRIEAAGGVVMCVQGEMRVNGLLNISRAFGDVANKPVVTSVSDFCSLELDDGEFLLMLACDGVWDALDESEVFEAVRLFTLSHSVTEYAKLADFIVTKAKDTGATDNMTLIVVFLRPPNDLWELFADF